MELIVPCVFTIFSQLSTEKRKQSNTVVSKKTSEMTSVLNNERQINNIIYQAKVKASISNYNQKIFYETSKGTFKLRYGNHKIFFHFEQRQKDTELSNGYRSLKNLMLVGKLSLAFILGQCPLAR